MHFKIMIGWMAVGFICIFLLFLLFKCLNAMYKDDLEFYFGLKQQQKEIEEQMHREGWL